MRIEVGELLKRIGNEQRISEEEHLTFPEDGLVIDEPVKISVKLVNLGKTILLSGRISAVVRLTCVRCLKEYEQPVSMDIEEQYAKRPGSAGSRAKEIELNDDDFVFDISEGNVIDMTEAVRQNLLTALPIKPLCRKLCKGLEMVPLAEGKAADPRLAKLKDILKKK
jgi:uncharacterized protein